MTLSFDDMKTPFLRFALAVSLAGLLCGGCGKNPSAAPVPLPEEQIPSEVSQAFQNSNKETQDGVNQYISDMKGKDYAAAFQDIQQLLQQHGLTEDQRGILARASMTTSQKLRDAASNGDDHASQVMSTFNATK
jgi:hypothetical protein